MSNLAHFDSTAYDEVIKRYHLHSGDGPVNLLPIFDILNVAIEYEQLPYNLRGVTLLKGEQQVVVINQRLRSDPGQHNVTLAHELGHILCHRSGKPHCDVQVAEGVRAHIKHEVEADLIAAYLLIPLGRLAQAVSIGENTRQLAAELGVTPALVDLRFRLMMERNELDAIDDDF